MLCFEGISLALRIFLEKQQSPGYSLIAPPNGELQAIYVDEEVEIKNSGPDITES